MIALGIDPGTKRIGYGLVRKDRGRLSFLEAGILDVSSSEPQIALGEARRHLISLIKKFQPDMMAVERLYFSKNKKTALSVAEARGVVLLCAADCGLPLKEYSPNTVKLSVAGDGRADKKAVWKMVRLTLGLGGNMIDDASDALALAILGCSDREAG